jgi:hypothetical protein
MQFIAPGLRLVTESGPGMAGSHRLLNIDLLKNQGEMDVP